MGVNEKIRLRREELGLTEAEVARHAGLSRSEYYDVEAYADEAFSVVELGNLRALCEALQMDPLALFDLGNSAGVVGDEAPGMKPLERNDLVRARRGALGMSEEQLADRIGFEVVAVNEMERNPAFLDGWPMQLIVELAAILGVPPRLLVNAQPSTRSTSVEAMP